MPVSFGRMLSVRAVCRSQSASVANEAKPNDRRHRSRLPQLQRCIRGHSGGTPTKPLISLVFYSRLDCGVLRGEHQVREVTAPVLGYRLSIPPGSALQLSYSPSVPGSPAEPHTFLVGSYTKSRGRSCPLPPGCFSASPSRPRIHVSPPSTT